MLKKCTLKGDPVIKSVSGIYTFECYITHRVLLRDRKWTSLISLDVEPLALGQRVQGGISQCVFPHEILVV